MARQNHAPGSGWVLVDIVIAAMAYLPALAHKPSRNFASPFGGVSAAVA
jgi:hypothetical protein